MANTQFSMKWNSSALDANLIALPPKIKERIRSRVRTAAKRGESSMKINAPWTDRTGEARDGLYAKAGTYTDAGAISRYTIDFGNLSGHGIWLEIAMSGKYQIIMPTLKATGDALMLSMTGLLDDALGAGELAVLAPELERPGTSQGIEVVAGANVFRIKRVGLRSVQKGIKIPVYIPKSAR